jgi:hypothetical protein
VDAAWAAAVAAEEGAVAAVSLVEDILVEDILVAGDPVEAVAATTPAGRPK